MGYKVAATLHGTRTVTNKTYSKKSTAQAYADATSKYRPGARPRVVKV